MTLSWSGDLLHIHIATAARYEMDELSEAKLVAGQGIEGDRYFTGRGTYSHIPAPRQVTLIEVEVLEQLAAAEPKNPGIQINLSPADHRRNLTTRGVPLGHLIGKRFKVGDVVLKGMRLNFPCKYIEQLLDKPGLFEGLLNRSGLNCDIEVGGIIRPGDKIVPLQD